ncbi:MAG: hypothetical protein ABIU20_09510 [Blastocatellia bacterium]
MLVRNGAPEGFHQSLPIAPQSPSPRKKGLKKGGKILFSAVALFPLFFGFCFLVRDGWPLTFPAFVFFAGLMRMLYARVFEDAASEQQVMFQPNVQSVSVPPQPVSFLPDNYQHSLEPPQMNVPTTGNLVAPPSVAEPTTNLLKRP